MKQLIHYSTKNQNGEVVLCSVCGSKHVIQDDIPQKQVIGSFSLFGGCPNGCTMSAVTVTQFPSTFEDLVSHARDMLSELKLNQVNIIAIAEDVDKAKQAVHEDLDNLCALELVDRMQKATLVWLIQLFAQQYCFPEKHVNNSSHQRCALNDFLPTYYR